jgi:hypothetical protein
VVISRAIEALHSNGAYQHIHGIVVGGSEPVHAFLANLKEPDLGQFLAAFDKLDESGHLQHPSPPRISARTRSDLDQRLLQDRRGDSAEAHQEV